MIRDFAPLIISLGKGEVESSILSCSTIFPQRFQALRVRALPFPPVLNPEQNLKDAPKLGEISGSKFAFRSADLQRGLQRREARLLAPPRVTFPFSLEGAQAPDTVPSSNVRGRSSREVGANDLLHRHVDRIWNWRPKGSQG
jgi:hypothetical protein